MSITAYVGLPGHGKSYGVVENVIVPSLKSGRVVYTNVPMKEEACIKAFGSSVVQFHVDDILANPAWFTEVLPKGAVIVIDELWRLWPSGTRNVSEAHKSFLAEHRHMVSETCGKSTEIILVTQDLSQVAQFCRSLIETTFKVNKLTKAGSSKFFRVDVYSGPVTGASPPISKREREIPGKFKQSTYDLYHSHTQSDVGAGDEKRVDGRFSLFGGFKVKLMIFGFIAALIILIWCTFAFFDMTKPMTEKRVVTHSVNVSSSSQSTISSSAQSTIPVVALKEQHEPNDFIVDLDNIFYVSSSIIVNDGKINKTHLFAISVDDSYAHLTHRDFMSMGYKVKIIADCLALISNKNSARYALCPPPESEESEGFISDLAATDATASTE